MPSRFGQGALNRSLSRKTLLRKSSKRKRKGLHLEKSRAKAEARKSGGTIKHEYTLIKGFTVEYPDDHIKVLETTEHLHVEQDGQVRTQ
ncbi:hypothetical protein AJ78_00203 [Emergomyces pasteurianus Ep9510]|uniref:Uncharacterized protein n=1 Tax=Emergomyces pasteurianus Ep9510 TaxID=1447872 RepID=A0A1J9QVF8_9EURO|nr:hypothetical protein AJ78_00203 [Emergomyces pasteurianus Ep9510]